ncbi:MAG: serine/threonine protein kinase [Gammaproteobacteria bacterium]|uniref:serine/threonine protein kinase n=1 Tax=Pseudomaricurvus alcaniphilus TaxID=1166482 RepID=UPI001409C975|nr:serine/threonine protein kinase [Pseudomaricurvus alcaniphilus]MBR9910745.1 serine/threonine protein kinase [Gammaproteobacteria bacterium]NHN39084.1 serine/threonine protein kinase [Pseudomaricurvus alcaniphilus]
MTLSHPYESLTPDTVLDAVEQQGHICDGRILALNSYENRVYQVGIEGQQPLIAKFYRPQRWSRAQIQEEHDFCAELVAHELPVVAPLLSERGVTILQHKDFLFALFERRGGHAPELDNLANLEIMGRFLGRMHNIGYLKSFNTRPAISVQGYAIDSIKFLREHGFIPPELDNAYTTLTDHLISLVQQRFAETHYESLRIHGDCHQGNILWRDDMPNFVDFDDTLTGPAVQDLWMLLSGNRDQQQTQLAKILAGYQQFCPFNGAELNLVESLRSLRIINYSAWLARRWDDPAFPRNFPWFNTQRYWSDHILTLREQMAALQEPPLSMPW